MSEQAVADFFNKVSEDESLQKEVDSIFANNEGTSINQPLADVAVKHGYEITAEDMEQLRLAIKAQNEKSDELNDEELEAVAGGGFVTMAASSLAMGLVDKATSYLISKIPRII